MKKGILSNPRVVTALTILCMVLASCAHVTLIAPYDERIEKGITELQKNTTAFFVKIERQGGSDKEDYKNFIQFYDDSKVAVKSLLIRAGATAQNGQTEGQIKALLDKYNSLENQLRQFGLTSNIIPMTKTSFEVIFRAILTLEVAKKDLK